MKIPVFVHIPKTAGNSVRAALSNKLEGLIDIGHSTVQRRKLSNDRYFSFCFVRHPLTRLRSAFYHLVDVNYAVGVQSNQFQAKREAMRQRYGDDFHAFIVDRGYAKYDIAHLYPQTTWTHQGCLQIVDFIGRLESIDLDWQRLSKALGTDLPQLERRNPTLNIKYSEDDDLPPTALTAARDFYGADFFHLEYD
jgi:hypothetical protein